MVRVCMLADMRGRRRKDSKDNVSVSHITNHLTEDINFLFARERSPTSNDM